MNKRDKEKEREKREKGTKETERREGTNKLKLKIAKDMIRVDDSRER